MTEDTRRKVFIVFGSTGEYSDRSEWPVAAYLSEDKAKAHAEAAKRWYQENDAFAQRNNYAWREKNKNPFDENMGVDYTGTYWSIYEIELRDEVPAP